MSEVSETSEQLGIRNAEHREIHSLISYKGGFIVSLGSGRAVIVEADLKQDVEEIKLRVKQIIKLPQRNSTTAGTWMSAETANGNRIIAMALTHSESMLIALTGVLLFH